MHLADLSQNALNAVVFVSYILCIAALFCTVRVWGCPGAKKAFACSLLTAILNFSLASPIAGYISTIRKNRPLDPIHESLLRVPVWAAAAIAAVSLPAVVLLFITVERLWRRELTAQSICEGLDRLPDGVCCSTADGFPVMVNNKMQQISNAAFGSGVFNTAMMDLRLSARDLQPGCSVDERDGNLFLLLPDGTVWQIRQRQTVAEKQTLTETVASDVTERYRALQELERRNAQLQDTNLRLRAKLNETDRIVREKEILAAKIRLHADLGQCILTIGEYLAGDGAGRKDVIRQISDTVTMLRKTEPDKKSENKFQALLEAARTVGVEIRIEGEVPPPWADLLAAATHECLTNTVKHAGGRLLEMHVTKTDAGYTAVLTNDGAPPAAPVKETGGLKNLRALAEGQGCEMEIESVPAFTLKLTLPKQ